MSKPKSEYVACLTVDDPRLGENLLSGPLLGNGRTYPFAWRAGERALPALQTLLQSARRECGEACVLARGLGCGAALALAEQLPVERLALIDPAPALRFVLRRNPPLREAARLNAFARRNLSLCVSDVLVIEAESARGGRLLRVGGLSAHGRLTRLAVGGETAENLYTSCENRLKRAITHFLRTGELPKNLAENEELCIIDG